jgi:hypothetical protein
MSRWWMWTVPGMVALLWLVQPGYTCSLCGFRLAPTFRQEANQPNSRMILFGTLANPELKGTEGKTDLNITQVLRSDPWLKNRKVISIPRYVPVTDPKNPPHYLVFCDIFMNQLDPYRGVPLKTDAAKDYVKKVMGMDERDPVANLLFFFKYLDHPDKELATDAFMEFARAPDGLMGKVGPRLPADKLRTWVSDPAVPSERLALYAFLLGAAGNESDASLLTTMLNDNSDRVRSAQDGILSGLMNLKPKEGWDLAHTILHDGKRSLQQRLSVIRAVQFYHGWQPEKYRAQILKAADIIINEGELADIAIENLRRWEMWDRTREILGLYGKKGFDAPIMRSTLLRYALCCTPRDALVTRFLEERKKEDPDLMRQLEDELKQDQKK